MFQACFWRISILLTPVFMLTYICYVSGMFLENFYPVYTSVNVDLYLLCFRHVLENFYPNKTSVHVDLYLLCFRRHVLKNFYPVNTSVHVDFFLLCFRHVLRELSS